jgi:D-serine deaminase-like pyridoxal phosphate-dependent protein
VCTAHVTAPTAARLSSSYENEVQVSQTVIRAAGSIACVGIFSYCGHLAGLPADNGTDTPARRITSHRHAIHDEKQRAQPSVAKGTRAALLSALKAVTVPLPRGGSLLVAELGHAAYPLRMGCSPVR